MIFCGFNILHFLHKAHLSRKCQQQKSIGTENTEVQAPQIDKSVDASVASEAKNVLKFVCEKTDLDPTHSCLADKDTFDFYVSQTILHILSSIDLLSLIEKRASQVSRTRHEGNSQKDC